MSNSKVVVVSLIGLIAGSSACQASQARNEAGAVTASSTSVPQLSDAARGRIVDKASLRIARVPTPRPFLQESGPSWVQWVGQQRSYSDDSLAAPAGNVAMVFATARSNVNA